MSKLKFIAAIVMTLATLGLGGGYIAHQALAGNRDAKASRAEPGSQVGERERERERPPQKPTINGIVHMIDTTKNTITVRVARDEPDGRTYELAKDVKVFTQEGRERKPAKLADLEPRTRVTLTLDDAKKVVQMIEISAGKRPEKEPGVRDDALISGLLTEVDGDKRTVTVQTGGRGDEPKKTTYELTKDAKVIFRQGRNVRDGRLANLELNKPVQLRLDETKKKVIAIEVTVSTRAQGGVGDIDQTKNTITIEIGGRRGMDPMTETYELSKDVKVFYRLPSRKAGRGEDDTVPLKLGDLTAKANVSLQLDDDRKVVQSIEVALITVAGSIQSVDADKFTLLLRPARGDDMDLKIAKEARIIVKGEPGKLDAITVGSDAHVVLTPDRSQVLVLQSPPPEGRR